jgi:hypothetical protein
MAAANTKPLQEQEQHGKGISFISFFFSPIQSLVGQHGPYSNLLFCST